MENQKHYTRNRIVLLSFSVAASLVLFSCKKESTATPNSGLFTYKVRTANASSAITQRTMAGILEWTSGYASVTEIEFEAKKQGIEIEYKSEAKQKINIFSPLSSLGIIAVPDGIYEDIEFEVEIQPNGSDAALELKGNFKNGNGVSTPIVLKVSAGIEIESKKENITITNAISHTAITTLNLALIAKGVTEGMFNNATRNNGTIEISATSNAAIYNIMLNNLKECGGVEVD